METLSIIIPTYNEINTIGILLNKVKNSTLLNGIQKEYLIVDDGSSDGSKNIIENFISYNPKENIKFLSHEKKLGKGASIQTALKYIKGDYVIIQDADLEYNPNEYNVLLKPMLDGFADVVYGSRFMSGNPHRILFFWNSSSNWILTFLSNILTNLNLSDTQVSYKLFKSEILKTIELKEKGFGFESEVTAKISRIPRIRIYEVGISYFGRTYEEGKKTRFIDALRSLYCILKYNIFSK